MSHCRIKYILDKKIAVVPITFFENWEKVEAELKNDEVEEEYHVFWSDEASDTPEIEEKRNSRVIRIEDVECQMKTHPHIVGYYRATLLNFAESKEELNQMLNDRKGRRILKPNRKAVNTKPYSAEKREQNKLKAANSRAAKRYNHDAFETSSSNKENNDSTTTSEVTDSQTNSDRNSNDQHETPEKMMTKEAKLSNSKKSTSSRSDSGVVLRVNDKTTEGVITKKAKLSNVKVVTHISNSREISNVNAETTDGVIPKKANTANSKIATDLQSNPADNEASKGGTTNGSMPKKTSSSKSKRVANCSTADISSSGSEEDMFSEGDGNDDGVPLVIHKEKLKEIEKLKLRLKESGKDINKIWQAKWDQALQEWKTKWDESEKKNKELEEQCHDFQSLKKKMEKLEEELEQTKSLNMWWQQKEMSRRDSHRSHSRSSPSSSSSTREKHASSGEKSSSSSASKSTISSPLHPKTPTSSSRSAFLIKSPLANPVHDNIKLRSSPCATSSREINKNTSQPTASTSQQSTNEPSKVLSAIPSNDKQRDKEIEGNGTVDGRMPESDPYQHDDEEIFGESVSLSPRAEDNNAVGAKKDEEVGSDQTDTTVAHGIRVDGVQPITLDQFNTCLKQGMGSTKRGASGDSMFCKNVINILLSKEHLVKLSAAGRQGTMTEAPARPEVPKNLKDYVAKLLTKRIYLEEQDVKGEDVAERTKGSKINSYLRAKIKDARRPPKAGPKSID